MEIYIQIMIFPFVLQVVESNYNNVSSCPECEEKWRLRANILNCAIRNYHCILDTDGNSIETCITPNTISPNEVGCPMVQIIGGRAFLRADLTTCPAENPFCPTRNHPKYSTNELYKYSICNVREMERLAFKGVCCNPEVKYVNVTVRENNTIPSGDEKKVECPKNSDKHCLVLTGIFVSVIILAILVVLLIMCKKRRNGYTAGFRHILPKKSMKYQQRKRHFALLESIFNDNVTEVEKSVKKVSCFGNDNGSKCVLCEVANPLIYAALTKRKTAFQFLIKRIKFDRLTATQKSKILHHCLLNDWHGLLKENMSLRNEIYIPRKACIRFVRKENIEQDADIDFDDRRDIIPVCVWDDKSHEEETTEA